MKLLFETVFLYYKKKLLNMIKRYGKQKKTCIWETWDFQNTFCRAQILPNVFSLYHSKMPDLFLTFIHSRRHKCFQAILAVTSSCYCYTMQSLGQTRTFTPSILNMETKKRTDIENDIPRKNLKQCLMFIQRMRKPLNLRHTYYARDSYQLSS